MTESILIVGYDYDEFRKLQDAGAVNEIVYDHADAPAELVRQVQLKCACRSLPFLTLEKGLDFNISQTKLKHADNLPGI